MIFPLMALTAETVAVGGGETESGTEGEGNGEELKVDGEGWGIEYQRDGGNGRQHHCGGVFLPESGLLAETTPEDEE